MSEKSVKTGGVFASYERKEFLEVEGDTNSLVMTWRKPKLEIGTAWTPQISNWLFAYLNRKGVATHFVEALDDFDSLVQKAEPLPIKVVVRRVASGDLVERCRVGKGTMLKTPIKELRFRESKPTRDRLVTPEQLVNLGLMTETDIDEAERLAGTTTAVLTSVFDRIQINLVDSMLSLGRNHDGKILVIGEISPMTCRLWDKNTGAKFGRDRVGEGITNANLQRELFERLQALQDMK